MPGINSYEKSGKSSNFLREQAFIKKTQQEVAQSLGTGKSAVVSMKNHSRGASVQVAKKAAAVTGQKPANIFLTSQVASLQKRIATKSIKDENVLAACQNVMKSIRGQFRDSEFDRSDPEFIAAAENLKKIAEAALDLSAPAQEPVHATGDSVEAALKAELDAHDGKVQRDVHGRAVPQGNRVNRDGHGRAI